MTATTVEKGTAAPEREGVRVRWRIALSFSEEDRTRLVEHLGPEMDRTMYAEYVAREYGRDQAAWLENHLRSAFVGTRLVLSGPSTAVRAAQRDALEAGLIGEEIELLERPDTEKRVYCPHCRCTTTAAASASMVQCSGCRLVLEVFEHFSRGLSAYLGAVAGAEDVAARTGQAAA
ncbi:dimethylamine monooxygenase subunit DmmA family protein [Citricoccus muralis]|uniref:Dimethylamine monooxygenase subunit DmmA-like C-terminal domain-containing protein n=1 Tax=Citricoccus muralis TaxID=169134 RepID=A0A3D9LEV5_9MICC|nr:dimethylamine monooxygenase subunit DmmA family protein [Citricoccus muralis]REE04176.1 hypothetical protein C8E99_2003 [Citricoccus muralis]